MSELVLDSIFYRYSDKEVLRGIYLEIKKGTITCLVGKNGSGKSTLFKIAAGQLQAKSGITRLNGNRFHKPSKKDRYMHIAYLPQKSFLPGLFRVKNLINDDRLLKDQQIHSIINNRIKDLSTGERRYVEFLFVLSLNRDFLLLDEPFTGLSPILIEKEIQHIKNAKTEGKGILISDHYRRYSNEIGEIFYLLDEGRLKHLEG